MKGCRFLSVQYNLTDGGLVVSYVLLKVMHDS